MSFRHFRAVVLTLALFVIPGIGVAQDAKKVTSWEQLVQVRTDSLARLKALQSEFETATPAEKEKLAKEYREIATRMQTEIFPQLIQHVSGQLEKTPKDKTTIEIAVEAMQYSYSRNDFPTTKSVSAAILKADPKNDNAVNFNGIASFAEHDFEESHRILSKANENDQLIGNLGGRYLETSKSYVEYWKKEQAIRAQEDNAKGDAQLPRVKLETSRGDIVIELFENEAPNTVANFVSLVEKKFYDGLKFHRVLPSFMAQGGCPNSKTNPRRAGSGGPGYNIKCEAYAPNARRHFAGSLSMAHAGKDTGGSQFFITHLPTPHLDQEIRPASVHTVFGRVIEGLDVTRALQKDDGITKATVIRKRNHDYIPETISD